MSFSSFYVGATGVKTHSQGLQVVSNNIANVNTVAYKNGQYRFENLLSQTVPAGNPVTVGLSQVGMGVRLQDVLIDFNQGSLQTTNQNTDLSITGNGFFSVVDPANSNVYYTRAGNFLFNNSGYLVNPAGYRLQGQNGDILVEPGPDGFNVMDPSATTSVQLISNLGSGGISTTTTPDPFFNLLPSWNGTSDTPLGDSSYDFTNGIRIYDSLGESHVLNAYYRKVDDAAIINEGSLQYWEYLVGVDPDQEGRDGVTGTSGAGALLMGTLTFSSAGTLIQQSAFSYGGSGSVNGLSNWSPVTAFSEDGYPEITTTFASGGTATFSLNFGLSNTDGAYANAPASAADVASNASNLPTHMAERSSPATTSYAGSAATGYQAQDGYATGYLMQIRVDKDGFIQGSYSNAQVAELDQISLYRFRSDYNLKRQGGNLFTETQSSGEPIQGTANTLGMGYITGNSLENSNVDLAKEFVLMITTQRGFQANTKVITTSDQMLQNAVNIKR